MRNVLVRVYDSGGKPVGSARVNLYIYQFLASGSKEKYTNNSGEAEFDLDTDEFAQVSVSVNGNEKVIRSSIQGSYRVQI